jgi:hypothetical protein
MCYVIATDLMMLIKSLKCQQSPDRCMIWSTPTTSVVNTESDLVVDANDHIGEPDLLFAMQGESLLLQD